MEKDKNLPPRGTGLASGNAGERQNGVPRTDEERKERHEELTKNPPFGKWEDWDACMAEMTPKYGKESAERVCGALKRDLEKEEFIGGFEGCVKHFLAQSDFDAKDGKTREESARAFCAYIGRKSGKIASEDFTKDMLASFNAEENEQSDLATLASLVQKLATKVDELSTKVNEEPKDINKSFEKYGYVKVPEPEMPINNLPITKSQTPLSAKEIEKMPWSKVHEVAQKAKR